MIFVATFSWVILAAADNSGCVAFVCDPAGVSWAPGVCAQQDANSTQIDLKSGECKFNEACSVDVLLVGSEDATCLSQPYPEPVPTSYPGERCDRLKECIFSDCVGGICSTTTNPCINIFDCGLRQYCDSEGKCVNQVGIGGACTLDTDCVNNAGCDIAPGARAGKCIPYGSVAAGEVVQSCWASSMLAPHPLCASGFCFETATAGLFSCSGALVSPTTPPIRCENFPDTCTSRIDATSGLTLTQACECSYDGYYYCPLFPGDPAFMNYTNDLLNYLSSPSLSNCNTERHGFQISTVQVNQYFWCAQNLTSVEVYHYLHAMLYPQVVMAPSSVLEILAPEYYNSTKDLNPKSLSLRGISLYGLYLVLIQ